MNLVLCKNHKLSSPLLKWGGFEDFCDVANLSSWDEDQLYFRLNYTRHSILQSYTTRIKYCGNVFFFLLSQKLHIYIFMSKGWQSINPRPEGNYWTTKREEQ